MEKKAKADKHNDQTDSLIYALKMLFGGDKSIESLTKKELIQECMKLKKETIELRIQLDTTSKIAESIDRHLNTKLGLESPTTTVRGVITDNINLMAEQIRAENNEDEELYSKAYKFMGFAKKLDRKKLYDKFSNTEWLERINSGDLNPFNITTNELRECEGRVVELIRQTKCYIDGYNDAVEEAELAIAVSPIIKVNKGKSLPIGIKKLDTELFIK